MKYKILKSSKAFNTEEKRIKKLLQIPDQKGTINYAEISLIDNPDHKDNGKFIFPVLTQGKWKCDQHFKESDLVDFNADWKKPVELDTLTE